MLGYTSEELKRVLLRCDFKKFASLVGYWSNVGLNFDNINRDDVLTHLLTASRLMMEILDEKKEEGEK